MIYSTWHFSRPSQYFDSPIIISLFAFIHKDPKVANVAMFFKIGGSTVPFKAYI